MRVSRPPWRSLEDETDTGSRPGIRKKGLGARAWLAVDPAGNGRVVELSRQAVMRLTGLPARDLRILDPQLSYPSTVLGRERAIVVGLEHIKAIITAHEVLLMNHSDPAVDPFVRELLRRVIRHRELRRHHEGGEFGSSDIWSNEYDLERSKSMNETEAPLEDHHGDGIENEKGKGEEIPSDDTRALPFEFIALEACFEAACSCLENEATLLENEAHPALDKLTSKISTLNLERVRQIKSQLVAITGRVQKVRDELEHLLDDDGDMAEMYLTDKILQQHLSDEFSHYSRSDPGNVMEEDRVHAETSLEESDPSDNSEGCSQNAVIHNHSLSGPTLLNEENHGSHTCSTRSSSKHLDVQDLEMLLEAYFVQIDSTLNKLSTLREYVDDTEDYINIMLDDKQNQLLQMGVMLTTATLVISGFVTLVSIFGMNIQIDLFDEKKAGMPEFLWTVGGSATGSIILYVIAIAWCKRRRLIE